MKNKNNYFLLFRARKRHSQFCNVTLVLCLLALWPLQARAATAPAVPPTAEVPSSGENIFFTLETLAEATAVRAGWVAQDGQIVPLAVPGHQYIPATIFLEGRKSKPLAVKPEAREVDTPCGLSSERLVPAQTKAAFATLVPLNENFRAVPDDQVKARAVEAVTALLAKAAPANGLDAASIRVLVADAADLDGDKVPEILLAAWVRPRSDPDVPGTEMVLPFWVSAPAGRPAAVILDGLRIATACAGNSQPSSFGFTARTAGIHDFDADGLPEFGLSTTCGQSPAVLTIYKYQNGRLEPVFQSLPPPACGAGD